MLNGEFGGSGGGVIWISANEKLILQDSQLLSRGMSGRPIGHSQIGSGGGAGGSI